MPRPWSDTEQRTPRSLARDLDLHRAAVGRVLDRVLDEVDEHLAQLLLVRCHRRQPFGGVKLEGRSLREVRRAASITVLRHLVGVDRLDPHLQLARVEMAREQDVVDDLREPVGLVGDNLEQPVAHLVSELEIRATECHGRAVDRRQRRPQLVRHGGDEVGTHLLDRTLLGQVAERIHRSLVEAHGGEGQPELAAVDLERDRFAAARRHRPRRRDRRSRAAPRGQGDR